MTNETPLFWYRPCGEGLYEGPFHHNSSNGNILRSENPDAWKPLYTYPDNGQVRDDALEEAAKLVQEYDTCGDHTQGWQDRFAEVIRAMKGKQ